MTQYNAFQNNAYQVRPKKPAMIGWWGLIPAVAFIVVECIYGWPEAQARSKSPDYAGGYFVGSILGGFVISLFLAWIAYLVGRRSQLAGTITFTAMLAFYISTVLGSALMSPPAARTLARDLFQSIETKQRAASSAAAELDRISGNHLDGIDRPGELDARLRAIAAARAANQAVLDAGDGAATDLAQGLDKAGVRPSTRDRLVAQFTAKIRWDRVRGSYDTKRRGFDSLHSLYQLLKDHPDKWQYNSEAKRIDFGDQKLLDQFKAIQQELLGTMRQAAKSTPTP